MNNLEKVLDKLEESKYLFLTGGAGVGKTTLTRQVIARYESEGRKIAKLASTGMAATLLGGQTLHSFFDLGICDSLEDLEAKRKYNSKKKTKKLIGSMQLIIIDEISMVSANLFEMISLRLMQANFEGSLLCVGDFLQLPPVVRGSNEVNFAFDSDSWKSFDFSIINLEEIFRTDDEDFIKVLAKVRFGEVGEAEHYYLHHLIRELPKEYSHFTYLFGKNISAKKHNLEELERVDDVAFTFEAQVVKHNTQVNDNEIERFFNDARVEKELILKVGVPVLFTRNSWNYFNGERGVIKQLEKERVCIEKSNSETIYLERVGISKSSWQEKSIEGVKEMVEVEEFSIYQLPLQLAFGITIHKSQGMSIYNLIIETTEIFAPSQFYVALSRSINPSALILLQPNTNWKYLAYTHPKAKAYVENYRSDNDGK